MSSSKTMLLVSIVLLVTVQGICLAGGTTSTHLKYAGGWPFGYADALAIDSDRSLAFLGSGGAVLVLDVSDPSGPVLASDTIRTRGFVQELAYDAVRQLLFVAADEGGFEIWHIESAAAPERLSQIEVEYFDVETPVISVSLWEGFAYVACEWGYVHWIDVSDPYNPIEKDDVELPEGIGSIASLGTHVFAVDAFAGVIVYENALKDPALEADAASLSASVGGQVAFALTGGPELAFRTYLLVAGLSGTVPGTLLPGGVATIPLNRDWFTDLVLANLNNAVFGGFYGSLSAAGYGVAMLDTLGPINPHFVGRTLHFAWAATAPLDFASNAVAVDIVP